MTTERLTKTDLPADISAEPGSLPWAVAIKEQLLLSLGFVQGKEQHIEAMVGLLRKHEGYKVLRRRDGKPFGSYEEFCTARPPFGLGHTPEQIDAITLGKHGGDRKSEQARNQVANGTLVGKGTNSQSYTLARLDRDRPDLAERVRRGEMSASRAAIEAGFRKRTLSVYPDDPTSTARALKRHMSDDDLALIVALLEA